MGMILDQLRDVLQEHEFPDLPPDVQLAVLLSPCVRIEPDLLRAMRLLALPFLDVSAESDLWFSDWIGSRNPGFVALRADLLPTLRDVLRDRLARGDDDPVHNVWQVLTTSHDAHLPPVLRLEERVVQQALTGGDPEVELRRVAYSLAVEKRTGLADWLYGAWLRLPENARNTVNAWVLRELANTSLGEDRLRSSSTPAGLRAEHLVPVVNALGGRTRVLTLTWHDDQLWFGGEPTMDSVVFVVPDTDPLLIDQVDEHGNYLRTIHVRPDEVKSISVPGGKFRGRSGDGSMLGMCQVGHVVRARSSHDRLPSRLLADAEQFPPTGREADQVELAAWLLGDDSQGVRLLHGAPGVGKTQLAHILSNIATNHGWQVNRPVPWLGTAYGRSSKQLVVVDAPSWSPARLAKLVGQFGAKVRVLVLARETGAWWEATRHFMSEVGGVVLTQQRVSALADPLAAYLAAIEQFTKGDVALRAPARIPAPVRDARSLDAVNMAAVLSALGDQDIRVDRLADHLLRHEVDAWNAEAESSGGLALVMLLATIAHPVRRPSAAAALVRFRIAQDLTSAEALLVQYERLYPTTEEGVLRPLRPLCLAAALMERTLTGRAVLGLPEGVALAFFRSLLAEGGGVASGALRMAVMTLPTAGLLDALAAEHPDLLGHTSDAVLAAFASHAHIGPLHSLWQQALSLSTDEENALGVALVMERIFAVLPGDDGGPSALAERYADAGLIERAVRVMKNTVETLRIRAAADPDAHLSSLAEALSLYSRLLLRAALPQQAIEAANESIEVSGGLSRLTLTGYQRLLAKALLEYGRRTAARGRDTGSVDATGEAITIYRLLNRQDPHRYDADLALILRGHADLLATADDRDAARRALEEALSLLTPLASRLPAVYLPEERETEDALRALDRLAPAQAVVPRATQR